MFTELESNKISMRRTQLLIKYNSTVVYYFNIHNLFSSFQVACQRNMHNMKPPVYQQKVRYVFLISRKLHGAK